MDYITLIGLHLTVPAALTAPAALTEPTAVAAECQHHFYSNAHPMLPVLLNMLPEMRMKVMNERRTSNDS